MASKYIGNIITKTPTEPEGPYQDDSASGVWTLDQVLSYIKAGVWPTAGNERPIAKGSLPTGIAESYYATNNHYKTDDSGLTWTTTGSTWETYGGLSSGNAFLHVGSPNKYFNSDFSVSNNMPGAGSVARYFKSMSGTLMRQEYNSIQKSSDNGATWVTKHTRSPSSSFSNGFHYGDGVWFHSYADTSASPRVNYHLVSLDDGETWTTSGITGLPSDMGSGFGGNSIYLNGAHYFISHNSTVYTSTNGLTWSVLGSRLNVHGTSVYGQERLIFYRDPYFYSTSSSSVQRSLNFISGWATFGNAVPAGGNIRISYMNGNWVAATGTSSGFQIYTSSNDCVTWTNRLTVGPSTSAITIYGINQHAP